MRLGVGHQHSRLLSILTRFMDYYSPFWGPKVISTINEPQGTFTCRSSTLTVFVDPVPFHGLLLIVLGPKAISMLVIVVLADSGPFLGLLLTDLGSRSDFHD